MYKLNTLRPLFSGDISKIVCDAKDNTYYVTSKNQFAIFIKSRSKHEVLTGAENTAGHQDGTLKNARFCFIEDLVLGQGCIFVLQRKKSTYCIRKVDLDKKEVTTVMHPRPLKIQQLAVNKKHHNEILISTETAIFKIVNGGLVQIIDKEDHSHVIVDSISQSMFWFSRSMSRRSDYSLNPQEDSIKKFKFDELQSKPQTFAVLPSWKLKSAVLDEDARTIYYLVGSRIYSLNLKANTLTQIFDNGILETLHHPHLTVDMEGHLCCWDNHHVLQVTTPVMPWKLARVIWIGRYKNAPTECHLGLLPKELIKEIILTTRT